MPQVNNSCIIATVVQREAKSCGEMWEGKSCGEMWEGKSQTIDLFHLQ